MSSKSFRVQPDQHPDPEPPRQTPPYRQPSPWDDDAVVFGALLLLALGFSIMVLGLLLWWG